MDDVASDDLSCQSAGAVAPAVERVQSTWQKPLAHLRRYGSPSGLLLALALFPLPWVEIQCAGKPNSSSARTLLKQQNVPDWVVDRVLGPGEKRETLLKQSGLQAALGTYTYEPEALDAKGVGELNAVMRHSTLMAIFPAVLLAGFITGFLRRGNFHRELVLLCALTALILLLCQFAAGFPVEQAITELVAEDIREGRTATSEDSGFRVNYTLWLGMVFFGIAGAVVLSGPDCYAKYRPPKRAPLSRARD